MAGSSELNGTILVIDDNEQNCALARATLEQEGHTVLVAMSGAEGLRLMEVEHPDCVLLDVRMPEMDGFVVCERIRALPGGADVPIVFLTALRDVETFDRALRAGGDDFLTKPVRPTELVVRVQAALRLRRLGSEIREHYDLVRRQRDDLMRLQLQKERLTAFVVHDLKNPVNSIDLHAQFLLRNRELPSSARDSVAQIRAESRHLLRLILNLLDISKSEEGKLSANRIDIDLTHLVAEVVAAFDVAARVGNVVIRSEILVDRVMADRDLLQRVLENLVENALRHAPPGTTIRIGARRDGGDVELSVVDQGPGVPEGMRDQIFDKFVQIGREHPTSRTGRGLGLTFCRLAVEAEGGRIWVEDAAPGAAFRVRLPQ
jgi:signal transduction histidine kinase